MFSGLRLHAVVCVVLLALCIPANAIPLYSVTDLGTLGGEESYATDINDLGQVVGWSTDSTGMRRAFVYSVETGMVDLGAFLPSPESQAEAINDLGQVVGSYQTADGPRAFLYTPGEPAVDLGTLGGLTSEALDINNSGEIVGASNVPGVGSHAFLYTPRDGMTDLGVLPGCSQSRATAINESGDIVGHCIPIPPPDQAISITPGRAFLHTDRLGMTETGTLPEYDYSFATDINNAGQVVGYCTREGAATRSYTYTQGGGMVDMGDPFQSGDGSMPPLIIGPGTILAEAWAYGINDFGLVAGTRWLFCCVSEEEPTVQDTIIIPISGLQEPFIYTADLGFAGPNSCLEPGSQSGLSEALAINNQGQIAGHNTYHACVLTPSGPMQVVVDVEPGIYITRIEPNHGGTIAVGVHSTPFFQPSDLDLPTLEFAGAPVVHSKARDIGGDDSADIVLYFHIKEMHLEGLSGWTDLTLSGQTRRGVSVLGHDRVYVLPNKHSLRY